MFVTQYWSQPHPMLNIACALSSFLTFACLQAKGVENSPTGASFGLAFEYAPLVELHCEASLLAMGSSSEDIPSALQRAAAAARIAAEKLRGTDRLRYFNALVTSVPNARALQEISEEQAEHKRTIERHGEFAFAGRVEWRSTAMEYSASLSEVEADYLENLWPERERLLQARIEELNALIGTGKEMMQWALSRLELEAPTETARIVVVAHAPERFAGYTFIPKKAVTVLPLLRADGSPRDDAELLFIALNGALHEHEERFRGQFPVPGVYQPLREFFDLEIDDELFRMASVREQVGHVTAEEAVRRALELPSSYTFPLLGKPDEVDLECREIWRRYLNGELDFEATVAAIRRACGV